MATAADGFHLLPVASNGAAPLTHGCRDFVISRLVLAHLYSSPKLELVVIVLHCHTAPSCDGDGSGFAGFKLHLRPFSRSFISRGLVHEFVVVIVVM